MGVTSVSAWTGRREGKGREGPGSINIISSSAIHSRIGIRINIEIDIFPNHFIRVFTSMRYHDRFGIIPSV